MRRWPARCRATRATRNCGRPGVPNGRRVGCIVTADDGSWGFGISRYGAPVISIINEHLGPLLVDEPCMATERLWDMMMRMSSPYGAAGLGAYAISAIDLALWDLKGKVLNRPVYELIGGPSRDHIECYATGNDTDWHMELGFRATKLACPYGTADGLDALARNEEFVARTRDAIGPDVELMLDCWMAFDVEFAVRLAERLRPYRLKWIEDCLIPEDHGRTGGASSPSAVADAGDRRALVHAPALRQRRRAARADILQPDIAWVGGLTACLKIAHIAEASRHRRHSACRHEHALRTAPRAGHDQHAVG